MSRTSWVERRTREGIFAPRYLERRRNARHTRGHCADAQLRFNAVARGDDGARFVTNHDNDRATGHCERTASGRASGLSSQFHRDHHRRRRLSVAERFQSTGRHRVGNVDERGRSLRTNVAVRRARVQPHVERRHLERGAHQGSCVARFVRDVVARDRLLRVGRRAPPCD
jgi:hypothetical protein